MQDYSPGPCLLEGGCVASIVKETHVVGTSCLKWRYAVECQIDWRCSAPCRFSYHRQWIRPGTRKKPIVTYRSRDHLFTHSYAIANAFPRDSIISFIRTLSSLDLCNRLARRCGVIATQRRYAMSLRGPLYGSSRDSRETVNTCDRIAYRQLYALGARGVIAAKRD